MRTTKALSSLIALDLSALPEFRQHFVFLDGNAWGVRLDSVQRGMNLHLQFAMLVTTVVYKANHTACEPDLPQRVLLRHTFGLHLGIDRSEEVIHSTGVLLAL